MFSLSRTVCRAWAQVIFFSIIINSFLAVGRNPYLFCVPLLEQLYCITNLLICQYLILNFPRFFFGLKEVSRNAGSNCQNGNFNTVAMKILEGMGAFYSSQSLSNLPNFLQGKYSIPISNLCLVFAPMRANSILSIIASSIAV